MASGEVPVEFRIRTRAVVESFLRTVVVLDDLAEMPRSSREQQRDVASSSLKTPNYSHAPDLTDAAVIADPRGVPLDADSVISGFADIGSVCAVLNLDPDDEFRERTVKTARRADIVILDWLIHDSPGDEALEVMRDILRADGQRLRLVAIYTGEPDLQDIVDRTKGLVAEFYMDEEMVVLDDFRISKGPLYIVILAKPGTINDRRPEVIGQEVSERQLADRLIDDFSAMIGGLMRNCAIAGIAAIRDNAHRILAKFEGDLDPAYLGHRLILPHPRDAEDHLVEALGSELISVLLENRPGSRADIDAIKAWLALRKHEGLRLSDPFAFEETQCTVEGWRDLLSRGMETPGASLPTDVGKSRLRKQATEPFAEDAETATRSNRRFAALLKFKTHYPGQRPRLSIGTILRTRECDEDRHFLCLQPKCDSVRLNGQSGFPLIPLIPLKDVEVDGKDTSLRLVLETDKDQWKEFGIQAKPSELSIRFFEPGENPPGEVVAMKKRDERYFFVDVKGKKYHWVAEMKDEHALGIAGEVASALSRPGPNDSEWLRRAHGTSLAAPVEDREQSLEQGKVNP